MALKRLPHQLTIYANWGIGVIYSVFLFIYVWHYTYYYLPTSSSWWQFGYKQAIEYLGDLQKAYPQLPVGMTRQTVGEKPQHGFGYSAALFRNQDRKSTRLNSSHHAISYAVFCLKK